MHPHTRARIYTRVHTHAHTNITHAHTQVLTNITRARARNTHTQTHTDTHTHTHTRTHTQSRSKPHKPGQTREIQRRQKVKETTHPHRHTLHRHRPDTLWFLWSIRNVAVGHVRRLTSGAFGASLPPFHGQPCCGDRTPPGPPRDNDWKGQGQRVRVRSGHPYLTVTAKVEHWMCQRWCFPSQWQRKSKNEREGMWTLSVSDCKSQGQHVAM